MQLDDTLIVFDVGGVLVKTDFGAVYRCWSELSGKHDPEEIKALYTASELEKTQNRGDNINFAEEVRKKVLHNPDVSVEDIIRGFELSVPDQISGIVDFKQKLSSKAYKVGILSTSSAINFGNINRRFPNVFRVTSSDLLELSHITHNLKPDLAVYRRFIGKAKNIIYIDDKASYLKPALDLGWHCIHFVAFPDPDEAMQAFLGSQNPYQALKHPNYHRAETVDRALQIFGQLGVII